jgi:hypothetical protein
VSSALSLTTASIVLLVGATYVLGTRYGKRIGLASALIAASGAYALLQQALPSSEVLADALWVTSLAAATGTGRRHVTMAAIAGAIAAFQAGAALPAVVIAMFLLFRPERRWAVRVRSASSYAGACVVGVVAMLLLPPFDAGSGAAGVGAVASLSSVVFLVLFAALFLAAPFLMPGALTTVLMLTAVSDLAMLVVASSRGRSFHMPLVAPAVANVLVMASFDAVWRRSRLPRPAVAVTVAAALFAVLERT